jgi:hypothetical protein
MVHRGPVGDNFVMPPRAPHVRTLRRFLAEARAQYDARPTDYLEGVVQALTEKLYDSAFVDGRRDDEQAANAIGRSATARVREYYVGQVTTFNWILGDGPPPIHVILTKPDNTID